MTLLVELFINPFSLHNTAVMQHEDSIIAVQSSSCLANLAELKENQIIIKDEGGIKPTVLTMRSRFVEVQREAGRLLANLAANDGETSDLIVQAGGHVLLISFLLNQVYFVICTLNSNIH